VNVQLVKASTEARQIDFMIIDEDEIGDNKSEKKQPELIRSKTLNDKDRLLKHIGATAKKKKNDNRSQKNMSSKKNNDKNYSGKKNRKKDERG
jgi:hypothetical protein